MLLLKINLILFLNHYLYDIPFKIDAQQKTEGVNGKAIVAQYPQNTSHLCIGQGRILEGLKRLVVRKLNETPIPKKSNFYIKQ